MLILYLVSVTWNVGIIVLVHFESLILEDPRWTKGSGDVESNVSKMNDLLMETVVTFGGK